MKTILAAFSALLLTASWSLAEERIHFWIKAFIPNNHPGNPGYVRPVPGQFGKSMIPSPIGGFCFLTDHRSFSTNPLASARLTSEFDIVIDGDSGRIEKSFGRDIHRCDPTSKIDCSSGNVLETATAKPQSFGVGGPHIAGNRVQVIFQTAAANPLTPPGSPNIDGSIDLIFNRETGDLTFKATVGVFPAFEAYASRQGGQIVSVFSVMPDGKDVWSLVDGGLGVNARTLTGTVSLGSLLDGLWSSNDAKHRFSLEIHGEKAAIIERSDDGKVLTRSTKLQPNSGEPGTFIVERVNDDEVLQFFGFSPELRSAILANAPKPSFFVVKLADGRLNTQWRGFQVIKDSKNRFKELRQPNSVPARSFEFVK